jgi:hypothetical protein
MRAIPNFGAPASTGTLGLFHSLCQAGLFYQVLEITAYYIFDRIPFGGAVVGMAKASRKRLLHSGIGDGSGQLQLKLHPSGSVQAQLVPANNAGDFWTTS